MHGEVRSDPATTQTLEMCAGRRIVCSPHAKISGHTEKPQCVATALKKTKTSQSCSVLVLRLNNVSSPVRIGALSNESSTITASDHHSMIDDSNCTNATIATVKCARLRWLLLRCFGCVAEGSASRTRRHSFIASLGSKCTLCFPIPRAPSQFLFGK